MATNFLLFLLCTSFSMTEFLLASKVKHFKWEIGHIFWSPDCEENIMIGINGKFPGPTIEATVGDTIVVQLKNSLHTEGVVIHWHGIKQFGTPWADGTASISQCAINPGETFNYRFTVDKAGTYFYHGHYGMQRAAGLYGSLIINLPEGEKEPFHYDKEFNLLLSDWYHQNVYVQAAGLSSIPFRWIGEPQTILINGRGQYNCSLAASEGVSRCNITITQCAPLVLNVLPNKTYRVRIASVTSLVSLNLAIGCLKSELLSSHKMTLVEADGNYIEPFTVNDMDIYSGESYSVLITTDQNSSSNYWISIGVRGRPPKTLPAVAVLNYHPNSKLKMPSSPPPVTPTWNNYSHSKKFTNKIFAKQGTPQPPTGYQSQIKLLSTQTKINGYIKWSINNISLVLPPTPYIGSLKYGLKGAFNATKPPVNLPGDYDITKPPLNPNSTQGSNVYRIKFNKTIDVILQNANALHDHVSEIHPWHLHGHDFWVLGYGDGKFTKKDIKKFNLKNPPLRNTVVLFPFGWTAIRFVADNPGVWAFHCHIEAHLHMGMGVIFSEGVRKIKNIPNDVLGCGMTGKMLVNDHKQTGD